MINTKLIECTETGYWTPLDVLVPQLSYGWKLYERRKAMGLITWKAYKTLTETRE